MEDYLSINRANWDVRASAHVLSPDYRVRQLIDDPRLLSDVVSFARSRR